MPLCTQFSCVFCGLFLYRAHFRRWSVCTGRLLTRTKMIQMPKLWRSFAIIVRLINNILTLYRHCRIFRSHLWLVNSIVFAPLPHQHSSRERTASESLEPVQRDKKSTKNPSLNCVTWFCVSQKSFFDPLYKAFEMYLVHILITNPNIVIVIAIVVWFWDHCLICIFK